MRIRTIKPEFFLHEGLYELEAETGMPIRTAYAGLWCVADREGRFKWEPRKIGIQILPYDGVDFNIVLNSLMSHGFIEQYEVEGKLYGVIPSFSNHQCINQREAQSKLPAPGDTCVHVHALGGHVSVNIPSTTREIVFKRDNSKCVRCGSTEDITIDHIFPKSIGGNHNPKNLRVMCRPCNSARKVAGKPLLDDLALDGYAMSDMKSICTHVRARVEGKGMEGNMEGKGKEDIAPASGKPEPKREEISWSKENGWSGITTADSIEWGEAYPACDQKRNLAAMHQWLLSNPAKAKKKAWRRFITGWLGRKQESGGDIASNGSKAKHAGIQTGGFEF